MTIKQKILSTIGKNRLQLKALGVKRIGLFGSFARADQKAKSDVDVLVEFDKKKKGYSMSNNAKMMPKDKCFNLRV